MTKFEAAVVSAYTGFLCGKFEWMHEYAEKILKRPIFTHEFADKRVALELKEKSKPDFISFMISDE